MTGARPSVGWIVHYRPDPAIDGRWLTKGPPDAEGQPLAAVVTSVIPGNGGIPLVTLTVFQAVGAPHALERLAQEGDAPGCWSWPPRS